MRRTESCYGKQLVELRKKLGLSQNELAKKAGYSERLIRKAESGEAITSSAIKDIAMALSINGHVVHPEDLICNPTQLTKLFLQSFATFESEMATHVKHFIDEHFTLNCAGDPGKIPFAGERNGIEGLSLWARCFFNTPIRPLKDFSMPDIISDNNKVIAWGHFWAHTSDLQLPPIWVIQKFVFLKGKLIRLENLFDTYNCCQHMPQILSAGLLNGTTLQPMPMPRYQGANLPL